jgi:hypothetical protein
MTAGTDKLLSLARESGAETGAWIDAKDETWVQFRCLEDLAAFAERIRQEEREKCADACCVVAQQFLKSADEAITEWDRNMHKDTARGAYECAHAIRSIGTTESKTEGTR